MDAKTIVFTCYLNKLSYLQIIHYVFQWQLQAMSFNSWYYWLSHPQPALALLRWNPYPAMGWIICTHFPIRGMSNSVGTITVWHDYNTINHMYYTIHHTKHWRSECDARFKGLPKSDDAQRGVYSQRILN